jgi:hypothetical protein
MGVRKAVHESIQQRIRCHVAKSHRALAYLAAFRAISPSEKDVRDERKSLSRFGKEYRSQ